MQLTNIGLNLLLKDKNWEICDSIKSRIEQFKRTMPLIQDLKNPAMRDRHWAQIKSEVQKPFDHNGEYVLVVHNFYMCKLSFSNKANGFAVQLLICRKEISIVFLVYRLYLAQKIIKILHSNTYMHINMIHDTYLKRWTAKLSL